MKKILSLFLSAVFSLALAVFPRASEFTEELNCRSAILVEASSGTVLYEKNADAAYPPASVTKIMTILLVCEAIDDGSVSLTDKVPV